MTDQNNGSVIELTPDSEPITVKTAHWESRLSALPRGAVLALDLEGRSVRVTIEADGEVFVDWDAGLSRPATHGLRSASCHYVKGLGPVVNAYGEYDAITVLAPGDRTQTRSLQASHAGNATDPGRHTIAAELKGLFFAAVEEGGDAYKFFTERWQSPDAKLRFLRGDTVCECGATGKVTYHEEVSHG